MHTKTGSGLAVFCVAVFCVVVFKLRRVKKGSDTMEFRISKTWNGSEIDHAPIFICLSAGEGKGLRVDVKAPFFNSPPAPNSPAGQPCDRLWDYEGKDDIFQLYSVARYFMQ